VSDKKRIMLVNEASFLSTGYGTYGLEFLSALHATGKYDLMEFAGYAAEGDERSFDLPWKWKSAVTDPKTPNPAEFGQSKFEEACLEFRPDIVVDIRDWWMMEFQERSPFRPYFHWAIMPTVDAEPQERQWLATYMGADSVFTYSDWGLELLKKQTQDRIHTVCSTPPGADLATYQVYPDKKTHRDRFGISADALIVGTVMRNQKRKLYPDLIEAFAQFLKEAPSELANKTFLYLHTAWPDLGWDIPSLIVEAGISHKVLFTYYCKSCGHAFPSFFQDTRTGCPRCGQFAATFPNSAVGVSRKVLCDIMNLWDCYVQYATCEGFGMPQVEAAACGLPVFAVDYSAMADVVRKLNGFPIKVQRYFRESETHRKLALPDNSDFVEKLISFLQKPEPIRRKKGWEARKGVETHYTWEQTCSRWMAHFDSIQVRPQSQTWLSPPRFHTPNLSCPNNLTNEEFVRWGLANIAGRPDLVGSYMSVRMTRDLNWGARLGQGMGGQYFNDASTLGNSGRLQPFDRNEATKVMLEMANRQNHWEQRRADALLRGK